MDEAEQRVGDLLRRIALLRREGYEVLGIELDARGEDLIHQAFEADSSYRDALYPPKGRGFQTILGVPVTRNRLRPDLDWIFVITPAPPKAGSYAS